MGSCISRGAASSSCSLSEVTHDYLNNERSTTSNTFSSTVGERVSPDYSIGDDWTPLDESSCVQHFEPDQLRAWVCEAESVFIDNVDTIYSDNHLPSQLRMLEDIAKDDEAWLQLVVAMVQAVNSLERSRFVSNHYAGPTFVTLLLEGGLLPTRQLLDRMVELVTPTMTEVIHNPVDDLALVTQRNLCVVYSFIAERMAGSLSTVLMTPALATFLERTIKANANPSLTLHALQCLEKLALTRENKQCLNKSCNFSKLLSDVRDSGSVSRAEQVYHLGERDLVAYQCSFLSEWLLDNVFVKKGRKLTYKSVDYNQLGEIINHADKTHAGKLSPDGLTIRCDTCTFECARGTYGVDSGVFYYEAVLLTNGIMQIGWATRESTFRVDHGEGVGDDKNSIAFDGCRNYIWHQSSSYKHNLPAWKAGDVLGCLIDCDAQRFVFYLNGKKAELVRRRKLDLHFSTRPYHPAVSLMAYQQCYFNFGQIPFRFPPRKHCFYNLNQHALKHVNSELIKIVPVHVLRQTSQLSFRSLSTKKTACVICWDKEANVRLHPCEHTKICEACAKQCNEVCPFCRIKFTHYESL